MNKVTKLWQQKDGTKIRICDMTNKHLVNSMKMLERSARMQEQEFLAAGNPFQGDIASYMFDQEQDTLREEGLDVSDVYPIYSDMHAEAMRRNLSV